MPVSTTEQLRARITAEVGAKCNATHLCAGIFGPVRDWFAHGQARKQCYYHWRKAMHRAMPRGKRARKALGN